MPHRKVKKTIFASEKRRFKYIKITISMTEAGYIAQGDMALKERNWKVCLDSYKEAIRLNPQSEALVKREMVMRIINYYNKDLLNP